MHYTGYLNLEDNSTHDDTKFVPDAYTCVICRKNFIVAKELFFNVEEICPDCGSAMMARMQQLITGEELDVTMERTSEVMLHLQEVGATNSNAFFDDPIVVQVVDSEHASEETVSNHEEEERNITVVDFENFSENWWTTST